MVVLLERIGLAWKLLSGVPLEEFIPPPPPEIVETVIYLPDSAFLVEAIPPSRGNQCVTSIIDGASLIARGVSSAAVGLVAPLWNGLSTREKFFAVGGAIWVGCTVYERGLHPWVGRSVSFIVPGFRWVRKKFTGMRVVLDPRLEAQGRVDLESKRAGSEEHEMTIPRSQCRIGYMRDGDFVALGCAIRFRELCLIGPDHVLADTSVEKFALGVQSKISLKGKDRIPLYTDLVAIRLTEAEFATIGVKESALGPVPVSGQTAQIVGADGCGTVGRVAADVTVFGRLLYDGTTMRGYSGAAYTVGGQVVGIHLMGGPVNVGIASKYVWCLLQCHLKVRNEDTLDWLEHSFDHGEEIRYQSGREPGTVEIHMNGEFHAVEQDKFTKVFGQRPSIGVIRKHKKGHYEDPDPIIIKDSRGKRGEPEAVTVLESRVISGEAMPGSSQSGGSSSPVSSQQLEGGSLQSVILAYKNLSNRERAAFRTYNHMSVHGAGTAGQTPAQTN